MLSADEVAARLALTGLVVSRELHAVVITHGGPDVILVRQDGKVVHDNQVHAALEVAGMIDEHGIAQVGFRFLYRIKQAGWDLYEVCGDPTFQYDMRRLR